MKIVEFGEDGKPKLRKPAESPLAREVIKEDASAKIKIREFDRDGSDETPRKTSVAEQGPFGAARLPQSIKIIDFDNAKAAPIKPAPAQQRPRGMKIVETE